MRRSLFVALILPVVLLLTVTSAAQARRAGSSVALVAYSTPKPVMAKLIATLPASACRPGCLVHAVVRPVGLAGQGNRRGAARRHRLPLERPRHRHGRRCRARLEELDEGAEPGDRRQLGGRLRRAAGQPEAHPQLGRPDQARRPGRHAGPVPLRRREVERPRRLRREAQVGQDRQAGDRLRDEALQERRLARLVGARTRCEHVLLRQGRRPPHVRERGVRSLRRRQAGRRSSSPSRRCSSSCRWCRPRTHRPRPRRSSSTAHLDEAQKIFVRAATARSCGSVLKIPDARELEEEVRHRPDLQHPRQALRRLARRPTRSGSTWTAAGWSRSSARSEARPVSAFAARPPQHRRAASAPSGRASTGLSARRDLDVSARHRRPAASRRSSGRRRRLARRASGRRSPTPTPSRRSSSRSGRRSSSS